MLVYLQASPGLFWNLLSQPPGPPHPNTAWVTSSLSLSTSNRNPKTMASQPMPEPCRRSLLCSFRGCINREPCRLPWPGQTLRVHQDRA